MHAYPQPDRHILARMAWLLELGKQLQVEYTDAAVEQPMPERLVALLKQLEAAQR
jgi:hypothetical protein